MTNQQPQQEHRGTVLNVSHCMCNPARMPVVPNRNEFFVLQKTRSQKCTGMYIFDIALGIGGAELYCCNNTAPVQDGAPIERRPTVSPAKPGPPDKAGNARI